MEKVYTAQQRGKRRHSGTAWKSRHTTAAWEKRKKSSADPEGVGQGGPDPPGKSQVIWGSIGNEQLDPLPGKSWTKPPLPPPPGKSWTPTGTLKNDSFL